ncbi:hypothetical protein [Moorena sp. SIO3H5]|uniref:hypothetical protein n=1 Tax=Moorena sp. SIO3H5 TaxID=2607834 RepID=UPI0013BD5EE3|nr:hypothetical protein [Moorena sp. SIO3H5]NEO69787.1 hypothetical protein [Moorena sp. SIO3H5]
MQRGLGGFPHERLHQDTDALMRCGVAKAMHASCLLPLAFPSWEGLGVGSSCLLPSPPGRG